jgi:hypothetical protein
MYNEPRILPLNLEPEIYAMIDENGRIFGTGTREVCEALIAIMCRQATVKRALPKETIPRGNVRAAIVL